MANNRSETMSGSRAVRLIVGVCSSLVMVGCGSMNYGGSSGDEIGDGFLSEGGWDPFDGVPSGGADPEPAVEGLLLDGVEPGSGQVAALQEESASGKRLEELFKKGEYKRALSESNTLRKRSSAGSGDQDIATFIAGASQYYLGQFRGAQKELDAHVKQFEFSRHRESALYYQASNRVRLREWRVGATLLDHYIASHPESLLLEFALFDRATCHFGLGENRDCLKVVERLEREYIYSKIRDRALALKGDALWEAGDLSGAQHAFVKAREAASELGHPELEVRCLSNLTSVAALMGENETAVRFYKDFFKNYADSSYAMDTATGALPALEATGGLASGLANLERLLQDLPQNTDAGVMNDALLEYARFYGKQNGPEKLMRQLGDLSSSPEGSRRFKEQLIVARLEALETYFPERNAEIRVFYKEMRARFKPGDLSSANVLKLADYISEKHPDEAIAWYENALVRGGTLHQARATLGLAKARARTGDDREAERGFREVLETFGSPELVEEATLGIARIAKRRKDWNAAAHYWTSYLDHQDWNLARAEARNGLDETKSHGAVAKAPSSKNTLPVARVPATNDPVAKALAKAEKLAASGDKSGAYRSLDQVMGHVELAATKPKQLRTTYRKAQIMHEDLGMELGR